MVRRSVVIFTILCGIVAAQSEPQPVVVDPGPPPSDAVILFDGKDLSSWVSAEGKPIGCTIEDSVLACRTGVGNIFSTTTFHSAQIHIEFLIPNMPGEEGQLRGNSGVYLHGRYEIQILDSYRNPTYPAGALGALYGQTPPLVNAARKPETWQSYDIVFNAPKCERDTLVDPGSVTVLLNGVLVQNHTSIRHVEAGCDAARSGPLMLQDHGFEGGPITVMRFRNIWIRPLD